MGIRRPATFVPPCPWVISQAFGSVIRVASCCGEVLHVLQNVESFVETCGFSVFGLCQL